MLHRIIWFTLCTSVVSAQPQAVSKLSFDVVSVKSAKIFVGFHPPVIRADPGRITLENYPLKALIREAYGVGDYQDLGPAGSSKISGLKVWGTAK